MAHNINAKHSHFAFGLFAFALISTMLATPLLTAQAQSIYKLDFSARQNGMLRKKTYEALNEPLSYYKNKYGSAFHLFFSFSDLNRDGRDEIFVQLNEQYEFRDQHGNVDTYLFAQTSKGFRQIMHVKARAIGIGTPDQSGLKRIYAYQAPQMNNPVTYVWNGKNEYIEQN